MFRSLLRFRTVTATGPLPAEGGGPSEYARCVSWLEEQCELAGCETAVHYPVPGKPVLVATLRGTEPELPCVVLNSHYDVVPVMMEHWDMDPWDAIVRTAKRFDGAPGSEERIFGRGAQDMKCVCAQYLLALQRRKRAGAKPMRRTVHLTYVPDEETGGMDGMAAFLKSDAFKELGEIGIVLDEVSVWMCGRAGEEQVVCGAASRE